VPKKKTPIDFFKSLYHEGQNPLAMDMWALGVTLYVMVAGNYPFRPQLSHLDLILRGKFIRYHFIPQDLAEFLKTMLTPMPAKRATIRCVLDHDWMKEGRNVTLYIPKEKPLVPPVMRNKTSSDPSFDKAKGMLAKQMGTVIADGAVVEPGHKVTQVPASWTKDMLEGWKANPIEIKSLTGSRKKTEPASARTPSPAVSDDGKTVSPISTEGKKVIAEMSAMTEEERQNIIKQYEAKHGNAPYKPDSTDEATLNALMAMPESPHAKSASKNKPKSGPPPAK
jgi:serine/threonine protein kinase